MVKDFSSWGLRSIYCLGNRTENIPRKGIFRRYTKPSSLERSDGDTALKIVTVGNEHNRCLVYCGIQLGLSEESAVDFPPWYILWPSSAEDSWPKVLGTQQGTNLGQKRKVSFGLKLASNYDVAPVGDRLSQICQQWVESLSD